MHRGSLAGYSPWGCKESDMTERLTLSITKKKKKRMRKVEAYRVKSDFPKVSSCLNLFGLMSQNTIDWMACKQQKSIPHSSGGQEVQGQGADRFRVW